MKNSVSDMSFDIMESDVEEENEKQESENEDGSDYEKEINSMEKNVGKMIEVRSKEDGFVGSYFEAKVVEIINSDKYLVQYTTLYENENGQELLQEIVHVSEVRPMPPQVKVTKFQWLDRVDAYHNDGWWVGTVTSGDAYSGYYYVDFPVYGVELRYHISNLRLHQKYKQGQWFHDHHQRQS